MLEIDDMRVMIKNKMVYINNNGVEYVASADNFYIMLKYYLTTENVRTFDSYLMEKVRKREEIV